jgi:integrase
MQPQDNPQYRTVRHDGDGTLFVRRDRRGRETWYGKFSVQGRQVKKALGPPGSLNERKAKKALAALIATYKPKAPVNERKTVPDAAEALITSLEDDGAKASTVYGYRSVAKRFRFFDKMIHKLTERDIRAFEKDLQGRAAATRWQTLRLLEATLRYAVAEGWANDVPAVRKPKSRRGSTPVRYLRPQELERVLEKYPDDPKGRVMRALTLTAAWTGLRRGELLGMRWTAIDWDAEKIHVDESYVMGSYCTPKSGSGRSVPLPSRVARELRTLRLETPYSADGDAVFTHPEGTGKPLDPSYVSTAFSEALTAAAAPPRRFHDLRHTYAVHAAKAGIPLTDLREWLGHADLATTSIYARYCPREGEAERVQRAMEAAA